MKRIVLGCLLAAVTTGAWAQDCLVNDPTGTPLNVRARPYGRILGALHNGIAVRILDTTFDNSGRPWVYIVPLGPGRRGWVYRSYLDCR